MLSTREGQHRETVFFDWTSFVDYCERMPTPKDRYYCPAHTSDDDDFYGTKSFSEAIKLARSGWDEGTEIASKISSPMFERIAHLIERPEIVYDVEGTGFDVARLLDGEPEHWQRWESKIVEGPGSRVLRILFNASASAGISQDTIRAKGAIISSLVQLLEYGGYRCELWVIGWACSATYEIDDPETMRDVLRVCVKLADQDLDASRVAFALAHPSMLRRLSFGCLELCPDKEWVRWQHGHGYPTDVNPEGFDIYIPKCGSWEMDFQNPTVAQEFIIKKLREQGVSLREIEVRT